MRDWGRRLRTHIEGLFSCYLFVTVLFTVGVAFGAMAVRMLSFSQKQDLLSFLQQVFSVGTVSASAGSGFLSTLVVNLLLLWLVWFLGIIVFGLPVIVLLVFFRGFILGFSVAFLMSEMAWKGALFAVGSVVPHNLISVPVALAVAAMALGHAISTIRPSRNMRRQTYWQRTISFTGSMLICSSLVFIATVIETYVTPVLARLAARLF